MKRWKSLLLPLFILGMMLYIFLIYSAEEDFLKRKKKYSLKLIFSNERGEYLSEVTVTIFGQKGESILTTVSNGPWFFINLPSGMYDLEVSFRKKSKRISQVKIDEKSQTVIGVRW